MRSGDEDRSGRREPATLRCSSPTLLHGFVRFAVVALCFISPASSTASTLIAGSAGSADSALAGSTVAEPLSPLGAHFSNPAGLAAFESRAMGTSLAVAYGEGIVSSKEIDYRSSNEVIVPFLETFLVVPHGRWTFGIATMGSSGSRYDFGAQPASGVNDGFFSEVGMMGVPIGAAWRATDDLWLGAELILLYGSAHLRYSREVAEAPGTQTRFRFTSSGFGVQAMLGITWRPTPVWSVGLAARTPGRVWTSGDSALGRGSQDVDLEVQVPAEVYVGVTRRLGKRWEASYSLRFTDSSKLGDSTFHFEKTPSADTPFLQDARDEWRHAIGAEYRWSDTLSLLAGFTGSNAIVGDEGVSPMSYDCPDYRIQAGLHRTGARWTLSGSFAYLFRGSREIEPDEALVFPGRYESEPAYLLSIMVSRSF
jgi:long-subunit fatty acid transport protein